ncbi:MAG: hypothetical protein U9R27_03535, partial [Campylobacterota bacterium]|nr:hypothetical protein [Campylobacterota bacterium]
FNAIEKKIYEGVILDITVLNIDYIAQKQVKDLQEFLVLINRVFQVVGGSNETMGSALQIPNNDLEDNLQYICAQKFKCDMIITNDKDFYSDSMMLMSSLDFIDKYLS